MYTSPKYISHQGTWQTMDTQDPHPSIKNEPHIGPLTIADCSIQDLELLQQSLLFPWEIAAWKKGELFLPDSDLRAWLMDKLDQAIAEKR